MKKSKLKLPKVNRAAIVVRSSPIHGKGVFAKAAIKKGTALIEYEGERISWKEAERRHPHNPDEPNHTFYFSLESGRVIDANCGGNAARWINHSCKPNCEAKEGSYEDMPRLRARRRIVLRLFARCRRPPYQTNEKRLRMPLRS